MGSPFDRDFSLLPRKIVFRFSRSPARVGGTANTRQAKKKQRLRQLSLVTAEKTITRQSKPQGYTAVLGENPNLLEECWMIVLGCSSFGDGVTFSAMRETCAGCG